LRQPPSTAAALRASAGTPPRRQAAAETDPSGGTYETKMAATPQESSFGRGAIVRVKLFQFLTYEAVRFGVPTRLPPTRH